MAPPKPSNTDGKDLAQAWAFEILRCVGDDGRLDLSALSQAMGHTNVHSTRNAYSRLKKRWEWGNLGMKRATDTDSESVKSGNDTPKKRGRAADKVTPSKKAVIKPEPNLLSLFSSEVKSESSEAD